MDIPGYKWDRERQRYFKVLKTGELPNSNYTVSALASKDRKSKRILERQERENDTGNSVATRNRNVLKLGSRSRTWYSGGPMETISSFTITRSGILTGSRDGTIALGEWKSEQGRSIVDMCVAQGLPVVAAVDNDAGSFVGFGTESRHLKGQFATQVREVGHSTELRIGIGSQRGLNVWQPHAPALDVLKVGSVSAISQSEGPVLAVGCRNGSIKIVDFRSPQASAAGSMGNAKMVTNIATVASRPSILATGLEDQMMLFDIRSSIQPVYQFDGYENWSTNTHGFALSPDGESVAVAMDTGIVDIYDVLTGATSKQLQLSNKTSRPRSSPPRPLLPSSVATCLRWTSDGLFMAVGNKIRAFPSALENKSPKPTEDEVRMLATTHSNINFT